ncbi:lantibiotic dehydratase [Salmonirosea aquatica]|uniref:Lantibiotic dehydratase n=1 Tax=Salmonirosea aquatica TaxID=2654236 RepID=A0A7C9FWX8_9BACT|nr:hypothetical protein [Cytophagaceae bacterium SJW1-29]
MQGAKFYWMRQPLLSIQRLLTTLEKDGLNRLLQEESVIQSIEIASPAMGAHLRGDHKADAQIAATLLKYVLRMSTRCTPFGLFAGGTIGCTALKTTFDFQKRKFASRQRLDTETVDYLAFALTTHSEIVEKIRFYANRTAYQVGDRLRYTERSSQDGQCRFFASEVPANPTILSVLKRAKLGATVPELAQAVASDESLASACEFIRQLVEDGLLSSELSPSPTGDGPLPTLVRKLSERSTPPELLQPLRRIHDLLAQTEDNRTVRPEVTAILTKQFGFNPKAASVVQTDTLIEGGINQFSQAVYDQLQQTLRPLHVLNRFNPEPTDLVVFKKRFYARYEEQEVPLLLALDGDTGVGYGEFLESFGSSEKLIEGLPISNLTHSAHAYQSDELHDLRLRLYTRFLASGSQPTAITDHDLSLLGGSKVPLPPSYYAFGSFLATSASAIDKGDFRFLLKALSGPSGFTLMGRFCAIDERLARMVTEQMVWQQAQRPDLIYAEIAHLPHARTGNVVGRPHLRPYEIPYMTHSELPADQQLHLDDLLVSVPNGQRVVIRSKRLDKEVVPQLTTAHDYRDGLPIYRFLCDLQAQAAPFAVQWHWGAFDKARRLPRVVYRNTVLQEGSWQLSRADLSSTLSAEQNAARLRGSEGLPRLVALMQGDQELFIDLDSRICCELFVSTLQRLGTIRVIEWLRTPDQCPVEGPDGRLTHEVVIPFMNPGLESPSRAVPERPPVTVQRAFGPGSEWLYLKVYGGLSTTPALLAALCGWAANGELRNEATHWFFVRFADPEPHLRFRIRLNDVAHYAPMLVECYRRLNPFLISGEVHSIQLDTYQRELERYGQELIEVTEQIFWLDSKAVSQLLQLTLAESGILPCACRSVEAYLAASGLTLAQKVAFCQSAYERFTNEHGATKELRQSLAQKYRVNRPSVEQSLNAPESVLGEEAEEIFRLRTRSMGADLETVKHYYQTNRPEEFREYLGSLIHMSINRLFATNQRTYELLIYHHLYRAYQSVVARCTG